MDKSEQCAEKFWNELGQIPLEEKTKFLEVEREMLNIFNKYPDAFKAWLEYIVELAKQI